MSVFAKRGSSIWTGWLLPLAVVILWELLSRTGLIRANVLPAPTAVAQAFCKLLLSGDLGCGKSTLLRLIAGLDVPTAGTVAIDGGATHAATRMMFQEPRLLPWARIADNVAVGLTGSGASDVRGRASGLLAEVGLADRASEWPSVLSGGQKQRVALARALVGQPRILALDEPLGALDALTRIEMQALLERIWLQQRFTAVLVTHDVAEAVTLADRIVVIEAGRIALDLAVDLPRPRRRGAPETARLEGEILDRLFNGAKP